jgi:peptidoglycan/LPS O-acetylase OafA/YrhL
MILPLFPPIGNARLERMMNFPVKKKEDRIQWLDVLRGVAILLVLAFHFTVRYGQKYPMNSFRDAPLFQVRFGWIGVYLFFMISGFIIYQTIQNKKGPTDFLVARLSRLMPPYWTAILSILILEYLHADIFHLPVRNDLMTTILNVFMVPDIFHARFLDGAFWSLFVEIKFYVLFAFLWHFVSMKKKKTFYISYAVLLVFATIHNYLYRFPLGENFNYFLIFWLGIASFKVLKEDMFAVEYIIVTFVATISTLGFYKEGAELLIGIPVFALLFVAADGFFKAFPKISLLFLPFSILGRISYSCYLVHQPIGYLVLGFFSLFLLSYNMAILFALLITFGIAGLGFLYVERLDKPIALFLMRQLEHHGKKLKLYPQK